MKRFGTGVIGLAATLCLAAILAACSSGSSSSQASTTTLSGTQTGDSVPLVTGGVPPKNGYLVYWDQNEEVDFLSMPSGTQGQLLPAWDLNGQVCILPDGRFVGGYDPTLPGQRNLGSAKPYKQPADGEELDEPNGSFSGQNLYVPGPYKMPGQSIGSDSPPTSNGVFNNNQTYTGCMIDKAGDVFGNDIATARGRTRRRAADGWWSGSRPTTPRTASSTGRTPEAWGRTTPTARVGWPSPG